jgi:hypothetical protein
MKGCFECTPRPPLQQLILLWHASDERGPRVSPLAVLNHTQLLSRWDQQLKDQQGWGTLMAVPAVGCWPNANAANRSRPRAFSFFLSRVIFWTGPMPGPMRPHAAPCGPMRPHAPGVSAGTPAISAHRTRLSPSYAYYVTALLGACARPHWIKSPYPRSLPALRPLVFLLQVADLSFDLRLFQVLRLSHDVKDLAPHTG